MADQQRPDWATRLQAERDARGWGKREMARQLLRAAGHEHGSIDSLARQIAEWEKGRHFPRAWAAAYATAFNMEERRLFDVSPQAPGEDDDEMQRRRLLQALAALGATSAPVFDALENIRDSVDGALGRDEDRHLDEWEETVAEYGYSYVLLPPHQLITDLAADLVAVQRAVARTKQDERLFAAWCRITSGLSLIMAKTLCNLGQSRRARTWWTTAQQAADISGDANLSLWVSGERLVHGLYEQRPVPILLRQAQHVLQGAPTAPCRGIAPVHTAHAQLLALGGQTEDAAVELRRCGEVFEGLSASVTGELRSIAGWGEDRLRYTQAWVYAYHGDTTRLDQAVERALRVLPSGDHRVRAQVSLMRSFGHVRAGDVTEGVRQAQATFERHPAEQRTVMVTTLADQVLEAVPAGSERSPVVQQYRELLDGAQRKVIT